MRQLRPAPERAMRARASPESAVVSRERVGKKSPSRKKAPKTYSPPRLKRRDTSSAMSDEEKSRRQDASFAVSDEEKSTAKRNIMVVVGGTVSRDRAAEEILEAGSSSSGSASASNTTGTSPDNRPPGKVFFPTPTTSKKNKKQQRPAIIAPNDSNSILQSQIGQTSQLTDDDTTASPFSRIAVQRREQRQTQRGTGRESRRESREPSRPISKALTEESFDETVSVYHLAHDDVKSPSPKHREKLNAWYETHEPSASGSEDSARSASTDDIDADTNYLSKTELAVARDDDDEEYHRQSYKREQEKRQRAFDGGDGGFFSTMLFGMRSTDHTSFDGDEPSGVFRSAVSTEFSANGSVGTSMFYGTTVFSDDEYAKNRQEIAWASIFLTVIQLLVLCLQLTMCGMAPLDVNPFIGPYPDAFSEWGGKNAYLMIQDDQWFRLLTPSLLHVGVLHLLANAFCQLEPIAFFEREWGSTRWIIIYLLSSVGCASISCLIDPDTIGVGSSGSLMGLFAAKLAQVTSHLFFDINKSHQDDMVRLDQLSSVICGLTIVSLLSFVTYVDWAGHIGGFTNGFFGGMILFCNPIRSWCWKILWGLIGLLGLTGSLAFTFYSMLYVAEPADEQLGNVCEYFRFFFPEDYECGCLL